MGLIPRLWARLFPTAMVLVVLAAGSPGPGAGAAAAAVGGPAGFRSPYSFLSSVSCPGPSRCMAVGAFTDPGGQARTLAERWDGRGWSIVPTADTGGAQSDELRGVSCASATSCAAVGDAQGFSVPMAEEWNGASWAVEPVPLPPDGRDATLAGVSCPTAVDCLAVGSKGNHGGVPTTLVERFDGTSWSIVPSPNPAGAEVSSLEAVSCPSAVSCTAVGFSAASPTEQSTLVERWDGSSWAIVPSPALPGDLPILEGVDCRPATCTAGGQAGHQGKDEFTAAPLVQQETAGVWETARTPHPPRTHDDGLGGVDCPSAARCFAVGSARSRTGVTTLIESGHGATWAIVASPDAPGTLSALAALACPTPTRCLAVGDNDNGTGRRLTFAETWNGRAWTIVHTPSP